MRLIYMVAADVLRALGWEVEINEKENYWNLVLTNTNSSEDMPESHKSCIRGLLRGWLMEFNYEGGRQQVNIYKDLHGLDPEDDRYSCLDTCVKRTDSDTPVHELDDREIFVRRKDRFDRYVLPEPIDDPLTTRPPMPPEKVQPECAKESHFLGSVYHINSWLVAAEGLEKAIELFRSHPSHQYETIESITLQSPYPVLIQNGKDE